MTRRVIIVELDAQMEKPAERAFICDPVAKVKSDRGRYIAACMIILRAYVSAGRPMPELGAPMNSFGEWSARCGSALVWLGRADRCDTIATAREEDPELQKLAAFIAATKPHAYAPNHAIPVSKLIELSNKGGTVGMGSGLFQSGALRVRAGVHRSRLEAEPAPHRPMAQEVQGTCHLRGRYPAGIASIFNNKRKAEDWFIETLVEATSFA